MLAIGHVTPGFTVIVCKRMPPGLLHALVIREHLIGELVSSANALCAENVIEGCLPGQRGRLGRCCARSRAAVRRSGATGEGGSYRGCRPPRPFAGLSQGSTAVGAGWTRILSLNYW